MAIAPLRQLALGLICGLVLVGCDDSVLPPVTDTGPGQSDRGADLSLDSSPDQGSLDGAPVDTAPAKDSLVTSDGPGSFTQTLDGVWLVGWIGGLNRFSWVRFKATSTAGGTAIIKSGTLSGGTVPYWNCSGSTTWNITAKPNTVQLHYPSSTCTSTGLKSGVFTFASIKLFTGTYPRGAQQIAVVQSLSTTPATISGYKFPASQCDAAMTKCTDPL